MIRKIEYSIKPLLLSLMAMVMLMSPAFAAPPSSVESTLKDVNSLLQDGEDAAHKEAHGDAYHAKEVDGLPQLDFTTYTPQLFWMFVFFTLLYIVFAKKTLPEISGVIEGRKNHIQSDLETAEKLTAEADSVHDAYQESLVGAQNAASKTIQDMEGKMKSKAEKAMNDFRTRSEDEVKNAEERIMAAKQAAMGEMNQIVTDVTSEAVEKIIGQAADKNAVQSTVEMLSGAPNKAKAA